MAKKPASLRDRRGVTLPPRTTRVTRGPRLGAWRHVQDRGLTAGAAPKARAGPRWHMARCRSGACACATKGQDAGLGGRQQASRASRQQDMRHHRNDAMAIRVAVVSDWRDLAARPRDVRGGARPWPVGAVRKGGRRPASRVVPLGLGCMIHLAYQHAPLPTCSRSASACRGSASSIRRDRRRPKGPKAQRPKGPAQVPRRTRTQGKTQDQGAGKPHL